MFLLYLPEHGALWVSSWAEGSSQSGPGWHRQKGSLGRVEEHVLPSPRLWLFAPLLEKVSEVKMPNFLLCRLTLSVCSSAVWGSGAVTPICGLPAAPWLLLVSLTLREPRAGQPGRASSLSQWVGSAGCCGYLLGRWHICPPPQGSSVSPGTRDCREFSDVLLFSS